MPENYVVYVPPGSGWSSQREETAARLMARWPGLKIEFKEGDAAEVADLEFTLASPGLWGNQNQAGDSLFLEYDDIDMTADFVAWWRSVVPAQVPLRATWVEDVEIPPGATAGQVKSLLRLGEL